MYPPMYQLVSGGMERVERVLKQECRVYMLATAMEIKRSQ